MTASAIRLKINRLLELLERRAIDAAHPGGPDRPARVLEILLELGERIEDWSEAITAEEEARLQR